MKTVEQAWQILAEVELRAPVPEEVGLDEALGRVLAEDVLAPEDQPPWDTSAMDGFALKAEEVTSAPTELKVVASVPAGVWWEGALGPKECVQIMTGAPVPPSADAVVPVEETSGFGAEKVEIRKAVSKGSCIRKRGENIRAGEKLLERGTLLGAKEIALLASFGIVHLSVYTLPRIAIIGTGDEVIPASASPRPGQIRNSNTPMLAACLRSVGALAHPLGVAKDCEASLRLLVERGLSFDGLLLTGGASVGERDFAEKVFRELGVELHFHKVRMKPGKPVIFGTFHGRPVFGLPGNPVSAFVAFQLYVRPVLGRLVGQNPFPLTWIPLALEESVSPPRRESFLPAWSDYASRKVRPLPWRGSGDLVCLARANSLVRLPERPLEQGEVVQTLPLSLY